jgi:hypothetical protein
MKPETQACPCGGWILPIVELSTPEKEPKPSHIEVVLICPFCGRKHRSMVCHRQN